MTRPELGHAIHEDMQSYGKSIGQIIMSLRTKADELVDELLTPTLWKLHDAILDEMCYQRRSACACPDRALEIPLQENRHAEGLAPSNFGIQRILCIWGWRFRCQQTLIHF